MSANSTRRPSSSTQVRWGPFIATAAATVLATMS